MRSSIYQGRLIVFIAILSITLFSLTGCKEKPVLTEVNQQNNVEVEDNSSLLSKTEQDFSDATKASLLMEGNNYRLSKLMEKVNKQQEITIAYLGGSITEGYQVSRKQSYASQTTARLKDLFEYENFTTVNAGLSGTSSTIGLLRSNEDIFKQKPDLIIIEFAVNDGKDAISQLAYDSLIKQCLMQENEPAVILLFTVLENGYTCQEEMSKIGEVYHLPMISVDNLIKSTKEGGEFSWSDYAMDEAHPNYKGHKMIAEAIEYIVYSQMEKIQKGQIDEKIDYSDISAKGAIFFPMYFYNSLNFKPEEIGGYEIGSSNIEHFPNGWLWGKEEKSPEAMEFQITGSNLIILYKEENNDKIGNMEVYIDGEYLKTINGNSPNGWNNPQTSVLLNSDKIETHIVRLVPEAGSEEKIFHILGFGTSGVLPGSFVPLTEEDISKIPYHERAIIREGNKEVLYHLFDEIEQKTTITIGFIGGSITQGSGASSTQNTYVARVETWFQKQFPDKEIQVINAGIGATTSQFACARVESDLLAFEPDFVVVEFSVNDENNQLYRETYESLIRKILDSKTKPALITLNMVQYDNGVNAQGIHGEVAEYYDLPQISMKDSIYKEIQLKRLKSTDVSEDMIHPNDRGHEFAAELITYYLDKVINEMQTGTYSVNESQIKILKDPSMILVSDHSKLYNNINVNPKLDGFTKDSQKQNGITDIFKNGWSAKEEGNRLVFEVEGSQFTLCYRKTNTMTAPYAVVVIDGNEEEPVILDGNFPNGWGNWLYLHDLPIQKQGTHTIEIRITTSGISDFYLSSVIGK
jgi:lysophospholipase L1-like esterase